jgi:DUF2075 family protein
VIVYTSNKQSFLNDCDNSDIEKIILQAFKVQTGKNVGQNEIDSWRYSLNEMARVLRSEQLPNDIGVAVEFHIPLSSKRIDVMLTGVNGKSEKIAILVELKQWQKIELTAKDAIVRTYLGKGIRDHVHPSYQAWSYASLLEGFNEVVHSGQVHIKPCVYLHNYNDDSLIKSTHYKSWIDRAPVFLKGAEELEKFRLFIKDHLVTGDASILFELDQSPLRPSKVLADRLSRVIKKQPEFILIDEQKTIFESILVAARESQASGKPKVIIVEGGPGTGKTVLALNVLMQLLQSDLTGQYVSKNAAPRSVYKKKLNGAVTGAHFDTLFSGSGKFHALEKNIFDFLIVDEAHRLTKKSGVFSNKGEHQVMEVINTSLCTIFLIDEDQRVTFKDVGSIDVIKQYAQEKGASVEQYVLESQFRCNGSDGYLAWLDNTLGIRATANHILDDESYDFRIFETPEAMHAAIEAKNVENKARVVAGYCWPWNKKANASKIDIEIGNNYRRKWNLDLDGSSWIVVPGSIEQVGCIHTCQGLEVDYIGVIIGPDLIVRDGQVITRGEERNSGDKSISGFKTLWKSKKNRATAEAKVDPIIKNTYRTLMSRGMKGCYLYCTDAETRAYFVSRLHLSKDIAVVENEELDELKYV